MRHTLCVARSLTQHSLPYSFGLRAAQWFNGLAAAAGRLEALELPVQTGGAAGTLAAGTVLIDGAVLTAALAGRGALPRLTSPTGWPPAWASPPFRPPGTPTGWP